jgi:hypothetical protein
MKSRVIGVVVAVVAVSLGCTRRDDCVGDASTTAAEIVRSPAPTPAPATATPNVAPELPVAPPSPASPAPASLEGPIPSWVPEAGRLTIVQAPDLARNLGLAPAVAPPVATPDAGP